MRIAQVSPLFERVPPTLYGGTERVVSYLTEELVRLGHDVTLFASGDSQTAAHLVAPCEEALRLAGRDSLPGLYELIMLEEVFARIEDFDIVHFHIDYLHFPFVRRQPVPHVTTMHGRLDLPDLPALFETFPDEPVVSISDAQRRPLPHLNWQATLYHGLPPSMYSLSEQPEDYLLFLGRICAEKGTAEAIDIATRTERKLVIAAKVDRADQDYFDEVIRPRLDHPLVEYVGEVGEAEKRDLLGGSLGLLFPIDWPEPFGMVMIEAFACGTPVIAFPKGSVPEIMREGVSGFVVEDVESAVAAVDRLASVDRRACRHYFEERFTDARMAEDHLRLYDRLIESTSAGSVAHSEAATNGPVH
jgi:glycosyltransferase involved in cell wall biosynthesis